jgi:hypothetical protein
VIDPKVDGNFSAKELVGQGSVCVLKGDTADERLIIGNQGINTSAIGMIVVFRQTVSFMINCIKDEAYDGPE